MKLRTFVALELPETSIAEISTHLIRWQAAHPRHANWVKPQNLHITLLFIGDVEQGSLKQLCACLAEHCAQYDPPRLILEGYELFPASRPRLLWAKLKAEDRSIFSFPKALIPKLEDLGLEPDRKNLKLHTTLARIKQAFSPEQEREFLATRLSAESFSCERITLYRSELKPDGPLYSVIDQYDLNKINLPRR